MAGTDSLSITDTTTMTNVIWQVVPELKEKQFGM